VDLATWQHHAQRSQQGNNMNITKNGSPMTAMTHIAIAEMLDGTAVQWMEKVTDEPYGRDGRVRQE
jgi:hypothetical protein